MIFALFYIFFLLNSIEKNFMYGIITSEILKRRNATLIGIRFGDTLIVGEYKTVF